MSHTKEPWSVDGPRIIDDVGSHIAYVGDQDAEDSVNARRIVACVNACAGVKTKILEDGMRVKLVHNELLRNMRERYQLLVALEDIYQIASSSHMTNNMMLIREKCATVIALVTGGTT